MSVTINRVIMIKIAADFTLQLRLKSTENVLPNTLEFATKCFLISTSEDADRLRQRITGVL